MDGPAPDRVRRAAVHHALGDAHRLLIVDVLAWSDRTPGELRDLTGLSSNLLAFHLDVLEDAGVVARHASQGDGRRRYVRLLDGPAADLAVPADLPPAATAVLFVCTHNSARSQLAAAAWHARTGHPATSAGTAPAAAVHPLAVRAGRAHGLDLRDATPTPWSEVAVAPDLVVSVCDRARESALPPNVAHVHWSIPDPADGQADDFDAVTVDIIRRVDRLARQVAA